MDSQLPTRSNDPTDHHVMPGIVLVGPPGSGKSTVARHLAVRTRLPCRDTDAMLSAEHGATTGELFIELGEDGFRRIEERACLAALDDRPAIVALGSGAVESGRVQAALQGRCVVALDISASLAGSRMGLHGPRPAQLGRLRSQWSRLMQTRRPLYEQVAGLVVAVQDESATVLADRILRLVPQSIAGDREDQQ